MKRLVAIEVIMILVSLAVIVVESIMGWPNARMPTVSAFALIMIIIFYALARPVDPVAGAPVLAALVAGAVVSSTVLPRIVIVLTIAFAVAIVAFATSVIGGNLRGKRSWVFFSLMVETLAIWAILFYGPGVIKMIA